MYMHTNPSFSYFTGNEQLLRMLTGRVISGRDVDCPIVVMTASACSWRFLGSASHHLGRNSVSTSPLKFVQILALPKPFII